MSKKLSRAEITFQRDVKERIDSDATENDSDGYWRKSNPIFIPKRKKFKR